VEYWNRSQSVAARATIGGNICYFQQEAGLKAYPYIKMLNFMQMQSEFDDFG
jgi:hypothetical protein